MREAELSDNAEERKRQLEQEVRTDEQEQLYTDSERKQAMDKGR